MGIDEKFSLISEMITSLSGITNCQFKILESKINLISYMLTVIAMLLCALIFIFVIKEKKR